MTGPSNQPPPRYPVRLSVKIPKPLYDDMVEDAGQRGQSKSEYIRHALERAIRRTRS